MPQTPELVNAVLFFVPGFFLVQVLYFGGIGRGHSDFHKAIWGVIASVPVRWLVTQIAGPLDLGLEQGSEIELFALGLGVALAAGMIISLLKRAFVFGEEEEEEG